MDQHDNPYAAPASAIDVADEAGPTRLFSFHGRIGRARFVVYAVLATTSLTMLLNLLTGIIAGVGSPEIFTLCFTVAAYLPTLVLARRRLHDFNASGWWLLLAPCCYISTLALLLFLALAVAQGTPGLNRFGPIPSPHPFQLYLAGIPLTIIILGWVIDGHRFG